MAGACSRALNTVITSPMPSTLSTTNPRTPLAISSEIAFDAFSTVSGIIKALITSAGAISKVEIITGAITTTDHVVTILWAWLALRTEVVC